MITRTLPAGKDAYTIAAQILKTGGLVALPTETVYGLAADAQNAEAAAKVYAAKNRPAHNPLIAHVLAPERAADIAVLSPLAKTLIKAFWPGPLTLVLPRKNIRQNDLAGLETVAVRCPDAAWRQAFLDAGLSGPLVMPSANRSGRISPTRADHVRQELDGRIDLIIDGGPCPGGIESTILKIDGDIATLLRPGTLAAEALAPYISDLRLAGDSAEISAPGMLKSHYAPKARVRLNAEEKRPGEAYLGFGKRAQKSDMNLSPSGDLAEAARNLYAYLRALDTVDVIAVAPVPQDGIGFGINDRLQRAAADR